MVVVNRFNHLSKVGIVVTNTIQCSGGCAWGLPTYTYAVLFTCVNVCS